MILIFLNLLQKKGSRINSDTLLQLLNYYDMTKGSYIPSLPLELALTKIIDK
jgi:hypothetical protein